MNNIGFDLLTLTAFVKENSEYLTGARLQKIQQPTRHEFVFTLRNLGETRKLYISIQPNLYHICFMNKESEGKRLIDIPQFPPMFCMQLRKYLENRRIEKISQPKNERILEFYFKTFIDEAPVELCLAIELMGKYSNVVLYNYDTNVILGCAHNVGAEKSREREMAGTLPYTYPQKQEKKELPPSYTDFVSDFAGTSDFAEVLNKKYYVSQAFANQICRKEQNLPKIFENLQGYFALKNLSPVISNDFQEYALFDELIEDGNKFETVSEMIDSYFSYYQEQERLRSLRANLLAPINAKLKKANNSIKNYEKQIDFKAKADNYRRKGDLVMANMYSNKDFSPFIEVFDYENNKNIKIELDATLSLKENANKFYKLYNKAKVSADKSTELKNELLSEKGYLEQIVYSIEAASSLDEFEQIEEELGLQKKRPKSYQKKKTMEIEHRQISGFTVYIGKNNKQNDYIVSKLSNDDDLWFHTRLCAGSHVLLKAQAGQDPDEMTIFECAKLAKNNSKGKDSSKVSVIYTKRKFIKKPPAANLGYVIYKNEKEIIVD